MTLTILKPLRCDLLTLALIQNFQRSILARHESLRHKLEALKIYLPEEEKELRRVLTALQVFAKDRRIDDARKLAEEWKGN